MANGPMYGKGIVLTTGFDLGAKTPLDSRSIVNTIAERDAHVSGNRAYAGMSVYVLENQKEYRYTGTEWVEILNDLNAVHEHTNKNVLDNITLKDISNWNAKSDFSGSYNDLTDKPTIPTNISQLTNDLSLATEEFVVTEISKIDLSVLATKDDLTNYVTFTDLEGEGFTTQTYVDNQIATHEHNTMSIDDANTMFNNLYIK